MFLIGSYSTAIIFCVVTMLCWGSWANAQKLVNKNWRYELFYWDYVLGLLATALIFALTLGSHGDVGRVFKDDLGQAMATTPGQISLLWAFAGGVVFNIANILLVSAIDIAGMAVAFPVGIGLALVLGVLLNYVNDPGSSGNPVLLFVGVALVALAIILSALSYKKRDAANADPDAPKKPIGKGLALSVLCGVLMSLFYLFVAKSLAKLEPRPGEIYDLTLGNIQLYGNALQQDKLTPYTANVVFAVGILISNCVIMPILMRFPFTGEPVESGAYWKGKFGDHFWGWVGGLIWAIGMTFNVLASGVASPAVAYGLGQGATLMSAIWGVFIWREFRGSPKGVGKLLAAMFLFFVVGLGLVIATKLDAGETKAVDAAVEKVDEATDATVESVGDAIESATDAIGDAIDATVEKAGELKDAAAEKIDDAVDAAKDATDAAVEKAGELKDAAVEKVEDAMDAAKDATDAAVEKAGELKDAAVEKVEDAAEAVQETAEKAADAAKEATESAVDAVQNAAESAAEAVEELVLPEDAPTE